MSSIPPDPPRTASIGIRGSRVASFPFLMGCFMVDMRWVGSRQEQIHIQQIRAHGLLSRSLLTSSSVTTPAFDWTGNNGRPSRVLPDTWRVKACRARSESAFPTEIPPCRAISFAANRISSSRSNGARMISSDMSLQVDDKSSNIRCPERILNGSVTFAR